jgi:integrase
MPAETDAERRDRAIVALLLLTGVRVSALISLKLKHVLANGTGIYQDAREVKTKFAKSFPTYFMPVGDDIRDIFSKYVGFLTVERLWGADDALFPRTAVAVGGEHQFCWSGLERSHWQTPDPVRDICRRAFAAAGLPYFSPHTFRTTLTRWAEANCHTPEEWKSFSQNLGHEGVGVTFSSYGVVPERRQAELIAGLKIASGADQSRDTESETADLIRQLAKRAGIFE